MTRLGVLLLLPAIACGGSTPRVESPMDGGTNDANRTEDVASTSDLGARDVEVRADAAVDLPMDSATADAMVARETGPPRSKLRWTLIYDNGGSSTGVGLDLMSVSSDGDIWLASKPDGVTRVRPDGTVAGDWTLRPPTGGRLTGIWVAGPEDVYVSTYSNVMMHWDGSGTWKTQVLEAGTLFYTVWGFGPTDVYTSGTGIYHSTGDGKWAKQMVLDPPVAFYSNLGGSAPNDVWEASDEGIVHRSRGDGNWTRETPTGVAYGAVSLWAANTNEAYVVGTTTLAHRLPGGSWVVETPPPGPANEQLLCVWGSGPNDVYLGTSADRLLHSTGDGQWEDEMFDGGPGRRPPISRMWGRSSTDVYLIGGAGLYRGQP